MNYNNIIYNIYKLCSQLYSKVCKKEVEEMFISCLLITHSVISSFEL